MKRVADRDIAAGGDLGVDTHQIVPEAALQGGDDVEIALGRQRVYLGRGAAGDRGDDAQSRAADLDLAVEPIEFAPRLRAVEIDVGPKAQPVDGAADRRLQHA